MIEIDDRVVMLLFILFLGYILFNRREGFNVGGEEGMDYNGKCYCNVSDERYSDCVANQDKVCFAYPTEEFCSHDPRCKWKSIMDRLDDIVSIQGKHYSELKSRIDNVKTDTNNICHGSPGLPTSCSLARH